MNDKHFFSKDKVAKMKRLLEGNGYSAEVKYGEVQLEYIDSVVVITTNSMPLQELKEIGREAFKARCHLIDLKDVLKCENQKLPFNTIDLANYIMTRLENEDTFDSNSQEKKSQ
ncbi:hypothetical protein OXYTRIMIC_219 [Oxytricha trifallax]|uniref:Uncharacterized protein n=1 Tax=Oxytricha trifallax TaxID=1172189 RepID=A0A073I137_9SPIT|nr:hypothetical protein OXYTRIMIC_219 [Oxytricha trifallax]